MKKSSKIILVLIVVILLVVMVVGGYFLVEISKESKEKISGLENEIEVLKGENENSNTQNKNEVSSDIKNDDKPAVSKNEDSSNKKSETEIANEAIRKALKDEKWVEKNIKDVDYISSSPVIESMSKCYLFKLSEQNGIPVYIVDYHDSMNAAPNMKVVTYKEGKVVTSKTPITGEYSYVLINKQSNQVAILNEHSETGYLYQVVDTEFSEFGYNDSDNEGELVYFSLYGKSVSEEKFEEYLNNMEEANYVEATELTNENVDKYVK